MVSERRTLNRTVDGKIFSVTVELVDGWVIREVHFGGLRSSKVDALKYPSAEEAFQAGEVIAQSLVETVA
jgi:hypothetical protein